MRSVLAILCLGLLQSCSSVPLGTLARMASFNEREFVGLRADEVGIRIRLPQGHRLDVANSWLGIDITSKAGAYNGRFELDQVESKEVKLPGGLFSAAQPGSEVELRLTKASETKFQELQKFVQRARPEDIRIRVVPRIASAPAGATSVRVWIDLRLSQREGYFALVDGASIPLQPQRARTTPPSLAVVSCEAPIAGLNQWFGSPTGRLE